jgi:hypothetical protein
MNEAAEQLPFGIAHHGNITRQQLFAAALRTKIIMRVGKLQRRPALILEFPDADVGIPLKSGGKSEIPCDPWRYQLDLQVSDDGQRVVYFPVFELQLFAVEKKRRGNQSSRPNLSVQLQEFLLNLEAVLFPKGLGNGATLRSSLRIDGTAERPFWRCHSESNS